MNLRNFGILVLIWLCLFCEAVVNKSVAVARGFLIYNTILITQRSCNCPMSFSCSCCQSVIILYTKQRKDLCVNFTYQRNGLNVDVALSSNIISTRTVTNYKAFQYCVFVPGCLFSTACINILELNQFPRSLTACLRLDIYAKKRLWQINYNCVNVSMELPVISASTTTEMIDAPSEQTSMGNEETEVTTSMMSTEMMKREILEVDGMTAQTNKIKASSELIIID